MMPAAFDLIQTRLTDGMSLKPEVILQAKEYYGHLISYTAGTPYEKAAASFLAAIRGNQCVPVSIKQYCNKLDGIEGVSGWELRDRYVRKLYRKLITECDHRAKVCYNNPAMYVKEICSVLNCNKRLYGAAMRLASYAGERHMFIGKNPSVVATGCVYVAELQLATKEKRPLNYAQREIGEVVGVTEVSVRNMAKIIRIKLSSTDSCGKTGDKESTKL